MAKYVAAALAVILAIVLLNVFSTAPNPTARGIGLVVASWVGMAVPALAAGGVGAALYKKNRFAGFIVGAVIVTGLMIFGSTEP